MLNTPRQEISLQLPVFCPPHEQGIAGEHQVGRGIVPALAVSLVPLLVRTVSQVSPGIRLGHFGRLNRRRGSDSSEMLTSWGMDSYVTGRKYSAVVYLSLM